MGREEVPPFLRSFFAVVCKTSGSLGRIEQEKNWVVGKETLLHKDRQRGPERLLAGFLREGGCRPLPGHFLP